MKLYLNPQKKVSELKKEFSVFFPYLKIELYKTRHSAQKGSPDEDKYPGSTLLGEINNYINSRTVEINSKDPVAVFEKFFQDELGLPVQVFRKAGDFWIETIQTDHLTLAKQNEMGHDPVNPMRFNPVTLFL